MKIPPENNNARCPLRQFAPCIDHDCAWYGCGECALVSIAEELNSIADSMPQPDEN